MKISNLHELLIYELRDLYSAESQITKALPKLISKTSNEDLKTALQDHLEVTHNHLTRLDEIAEEIEFKSQLPVCVGIKGIITEGDKVVAEISDPATRDAAIISAAQRVEHYEIAGYGTAMSFANEMSHDYVADLLQQTLDEESDADKLLTSLAEGGLLSVGINSAAAKEETEEE
jgi:ferritin-like metal-binding protein YciE